MTRSVLPALFLLACSATDTAPLATVDSASWMSQVVLHPEQFRALTDADRDGWVALHGSALATAVTAFSEDSTGARRARLARQVVYTDLAAITDIAVWRTLEQWQQQALPVDEGMAGVAPMWRRCGGPDRLPERFHASGPVPMDGTILPQWAEERATAWAGKADPLRELVSEPIYQNETRVVRDPCGYAFLVAADDPSALMGALGTSEDLGARFLSATATPEDLSAAVAREPDPGAFGARSPSLPEFQADDLTTLHESVRALDAYIDSQRAELVARAPDEGKELMEALGLAERLRQEVLTARAHALVATQPELALALADIAWDATDRRVGPRNLPSTASVRARALLAAGRPREALDALEPLIAAFPEAAGAREWVADLVVLQHMGRAGNSKEN